MTSIQFRRNAMISLFYTLVAIACLFLTSSHSFVHVIVVQPTAAFRGCSRRQQQTTARFPPRLRHRSQVEDDYDDHTGDPEMIDIAVIGGGPTGLACTLAILHATSSMNTTTTTTNENDVLPSIAIFESDSFEPKGASIVISTPGWKALQCIDQQTYSEARNEGARVSALYFKDFSGTSLLPRPAQFVMTWVVRPVLKLFRTGLVRSNSWHAFRETLRRGVERVGLERGYNNNNLIRTNTSLVSMDPTYSNGNRTLLLFNDGKKVAASTVLACDGTFSTVRKCLEVYNGPPFLINEGKTVWRGTAPNIHTHGKSTFYVAQEEATTKGGATAAIFPAGQTTAGSSLSIILSTSPPGRATGSDDARRRLKETLEELDVPLDDVLMDTINDVEYMLEHKLHVRDFDAYPNLYSGFDRVAFVGDSAHPLRPTGEGVGLALEDAWTMGNVVAASQDNGLTPEVLRNYEDCRQSRVVAVCKAVRGFAESYYDTEGGDVSKDGNKKKKKIQTTNAVVKQAMKDYPIKVILLQKST